MISGEQKVDENVELFIRREAANEERGSRASQARATQLPTPIVDAPQGAQVSAHELSAMNPILERIPDETLRRTVRSYFMITTKYQALNMLCAPHSVLRAQHPGLLNELINAATKTDRLARGEVKRG